MKILKGCLLILFFSLAFTPGCRQDRASEFDATTALRLEAEGWKKLDGILQRIVAPEFPDRQLNVKDLGARGNAVADDRPAFIRGITDLSAQGGGTLLVPAGQYLIDGPLHLQSNIRLHLEEGARIVFGQDASKYLPAVKVRWEGTVCYNYSPLIYAIGQKNIAITGKGTIDGAAKEWSREWRKVQNPEKDRLRKMGNDLVPEEQRVFGNGFLDLDGDGKDDGFGDGKEHFLRPSLVEFYECENILLENLTLKDSPLWTVHPVFCRNVTIRNLKVSGEVLNDDGIDPDSSEDVLIEGCRIQTHDDAIAIKAGRDQDAWDRPGSKNIVIRNNHLLSGANALCIGSEMSGGVENVFAYNNTIAGGKHALNFKTNLDRGGQVQNFFLKDTKIESCEEAMFIFRMDYHGYRGNHFPTKFNDFFVSGIDCGKVTGLPFKIVGVEDQPIRRIFLSNIRVNEAGEESELKYAEELVFHEVFIGDERYEGP